MKTKTLAVAGVVLVLIGIAGLALTWAVTTGNGERPLSASWFEMMCPD